MVGVVFSSTNNTSEHLMVPCNAYKWKSFPFKWLERSLHCL